MKAYGKIKQVLKALHTNGVKSVSITELICMTGLSAKTIEGYMDKHYRIEDYATDWGSKDEN